MPAALEWKPSHISCSMYAEHWRALWASFMHIHLCFMFSEIKITVISVWVHFKIDHSELVASNVWKESIITKTKQGKEVILAEAKYCSSTVVNKCRCLGHCYNRSSYFSIIYFILPCLQLQLSQILAILLWASPLLYILAYFQSSLLDPFWSHTPSTSVFSFKIHYQIRGFI
jgi:hypothetical protein